jgi:hypothetical protein
MDDEARRDGALREGDDVIEREGIAINHLLVHVRRDIVRLQEGLILLADGLAAGQEKCDEEKREKTKGFHGINVIG